MHNKYRNLTLLTAIIGFIILVSCSEKQAETNTQNSSALDPAKSPQYCGSCHPRIYQEWQSSAMGQDLNNSVVYQFYTGRCHTPSATGLPVILDFNISAGV